MEGGKRREGGRDRKREEEREAGKEAGRQGRRGVLPKNCLQSLAARHSSELLSSGPAST